MTSNKNPFPESDQKAYLRRRHLVHLANRKQVLGRNLAYLGLPSARMLDVKAWKHFLGRITAIERDKDVATAMYRTATLLGVRRKTVILETDLKEASELLAVQDVSALIATLQPTEQKRIQKVRSTPYDVVNLDLCGGFLYPKKDGTSENVLTLKNIIAFQARFKQPFTLVLTFALRDTGGKVYEEFIDSTMQRLDQNFNIDTSEFRDWYARKNIKAQPKNLRKLRFCVPAYLHSEAFQDYQVRSLGAWYYKKQFYHTALFFEPRLGKNALGLMWPPIDEFKELLQAPMTEVLVDGGHIQLIDLEAPQIPEHKV